MKRRRPKPPPKRKSCEGKIKHSREKAKREAARLNEIAIVKGEVVRFNYYPCSYCGYYHVGRKLQFHSRGSYKENFSVY